MKGASAVAYSLLMVSIVPASLSAKGNTMKITIKGAALTTLSPIYCENLQLIAVRRGLVAQRVPARNESAANWLPRSGPSVRRSR